MRNTLTRLFAGLALALAVLAGPAAAAGISNYLENELTDHVFRGRSFSAPTTLCVGLWQSSATLTDASTGATAGEASYTNYARAQLDASFSNWKGTGNETTATDSTGTGGQAKNNAILTFGTAAGSGPQTMGYVVVLDSCTLGAGNILFYGALTANKSVNNGDPAPTFPVEALVIQVTD